MSSYATTDDLDSRVDVAVALPITDLPADTWLVVSTVKIDTPQTLTYRLAQLHILGAIGVSGAQLGQAVLPNADGLCVFPTAPGEVNGGLGLCWLGVYQGFDPTSPPVAQTLSEPTVSVPYAQTIVLPASADRGVVPIVLSAPGTYSFVLYNNTTNYTLRVAVAGQVRVNVA